MMSGGQRKPIADVHPHSKLHPLVSSIAEDTSHTPVGKSKRSYVVGEFIRVKFTLHMCTHTHTCRGSQQMNTRWSTGDWGVGGGRGVSVGRVSQLGPFEPMSSCKSSS